jgi:SPOR domain
MKKLAAVLVIANVAVYWVWHYLTPPASVPPTEKATPPARILLASERPQPTAECRSLGPLANRQAMTAVTRWMGERFGELTEREATVPAPPVYRVQVETVSADQAARLAQRLRGSGLADIAVLPPEPGESSVIVAMGLFGDRANADRRAMEMRRHGVEPAVFPMERHVSQWWIDFTSLETPDLSDLARTASVGTGVALAPCEVVIPGDEAPPSPAPSATPDPKASPPPKLGGGRSSGSAA